MARANGCCAAADGREVETVYIPEPERGTVCISTQVGCSLTCSFCHTGTMPLVRNLHAGEILAQLMVARDALGEWPTPTGARRLSHIVVMGMGEPLLTLSRPRAPCASRWTPTVSLARRRITPRPRAWCPRSRPAAASSASALRLKRMRCDEPAPVGAH